MWEPRPLEEVCGGQLVCARSRCLLLKGGSSLLGPFNSHDARFGLQTELDQLKYEATS